MKTNRKHMKIIDNQWKTKKSCIQGRPGLPGVRVDRTRTGPGPANQKPMKTIKENHWKPLKTNENPWKSIKADDKPMKTNENQWKPMKTNENQ